MASCRILTVVGARPQFIKASALSRAIAARDDVEEVLVHTGQHYDDNMSDVFFRELEMSPPAHNLGIGNLPSGAMTGRQLEAIESVLLAERPDILLVYGDTNSTLAGALAASKLHIRVAHVEAGLRSFNRAMPEEINRVLTDHLSDWLFAPTQAAVANLGREGVKRGVHLVGDVMFDVARYFGSRAAANSTVRGELGLDHKRYALATVHRAENTDDPARLGAIFDALTELSRQLPVVLPLHPRTRVVLERLGRLGAMAGQLHIVAPVGYLTMCDLLQGAALVATDSGGLQKEAFFAETPCVTLRDETEWVELVERGWNRLAPPTDAGSIVEAFNAALHSQPKPDPTLYGDGNAARLILDTLLQGPATR